MAMLQTLTRTLRSTDEPVEANAATAAGLVGAVLARMERRFGLMSRVEEIVVVEVLADSTDLAVADRLAFVACAQRHRSLVVVESGGQFFVCATERDMDVSDVAHVDAPGSGEPRLMSIASARGITPVLGPLVA